MYGKQLNRGLVLVTWNDLHSCAADGKVCREEQKDARPESVGKEYATQKLKHC